MSIQMRCRSGHTTCVASPARDGHPQNAKGAAGAGLATRRRDLDGTVIRLDDFLFYKDVRVFVHPDRFINFRLLKRREML